MSKIQRWKEVKAAIATSKNAVDLFSERDKIAIDDLYDLTESVHDLLLADKKCTVEMSSCVIGITKAYMKVLERYCGNNPELKKVLKACEKSLEVFATGFEIVKIGLALKAFNVNPAGACAAAWGGPTIAKAGIDFIRWVAPGLDTDAETKKIENRVFSLVGGGAGAGAGIGVIVGGAIGFLMGGVGAPVGAAIGAALGGSAGSVTGAVIFALD